MACSIPNSLLFYVLSSVLLLAVGTGGHEAHLHFYMHDIVTGPNATTVQVINSTGPLLKAVPVHFGDTWVIDDLLTQDPSPTSKPVGRAQGFYMFASPTEPALLVSMNVVLTEGPYNGSAVTITGRDDFSTPLRELSVIGGTGQFRMARGYVLWKTSSIDGENAVLELDVYVHA